jgi:hypothetical protein
VNPLILHKFLFSKIDLTLSANLKDSGKSLSRE